MTQQLHSEIHNPREIETHIHTKTLYINTCSSIIPNSQKVETTCMSAIG